VMVLVLSENANAAPHIEREIAHAFYTRRIIIPFRLANTFPRRDFLFYLGNVPGFNAVSPPAEQHLEALTARIKGLVPGGAVTCNPYSSSKCEKADGNVRFFELLDRCSTSFSLPNAGNLETGSDRRIPFCGPVAVVVCTPANERRGVTGGEYTPIDVPRSKRFSEVIATA
jgi:hypothetical protein